MAVHPASSATRCRQVEIGRRPSAFGSHRQWSAELSLDPVDLRDKGERVEAKAARCGTEVRVGRCSRESAQAFAGALAAECRPEDAWRSAGLLDGPKCLAVAGASACSQGDVVDLRPSGHVRGAHSFLCCEVAQGVAAVDVLLDQPVRSTVPRRDAGRRRGGDGPAPGRGGRPHRRPGLPVRRQRPQRPPESRAARTGSAGISPDPFGCIDIRTHPIRQRRPSRPQPGPEGRRHARPRIDQSAG